MIRSSVVATAVRALALCIVHKVGEKHRVWVPGENAHLRTGDSQNQTHHCRPVWPVSPSPPHPAAAWTARRARGPEVSEHLAGQRCATTYSRAFITWDFSYCTCTALIHEVSALCFIRKALNSLNIGAVIPGRAAHASNIVVYTQGTW